MNSFSSGCQSDWVRDAFVAPKLMLSFRGNTTVVSVPHSKHDRISRGQRHAVLRLWTRIHLWRRITSLAWRIHVQKSYNEYDRFDFDSIREPECKCEFCIEQNDIPLLADILQLPEVFRCSQRTVASKTEGPCMLLKRTAYPCRYNDIIQRFGRPVPEICMITNAVINCLYENHRMEPWRSFSCFPRDLCSSHPSQRSCIRKLLWISTRNFSPNFKAGRKSTRSL